MVNGGYMMGMIASWSCWTVAYSSTHSWFTEMSFEFQCVITVVDELIGASAITGAQKNRVGRNPTVIGYQQNGKRDHENRWHVRCSRLFCVSWWWSPAQLQTSGPLEKGRAEISSAATGVAGHPSWRQEVHGAQCGTRQSELHGAWHGHVARSQLFKEVSWHNDTTGIGK